MARAPEGALRRSASAFLLAAGITVAACGDDSGGTTTPPPTGDGGGGGVDSGGPTNNDAGGGSNDGGGTLDGGGPPIADAAPLTDASAEELAAALNPAGVNVSLGRATLVGTAACARGKQCGSADGQKPECVSIITDAYKEAVAAHYSDACIDSTLDLYACLVMLPCDDFDTATGCSTIVDVRDNNCSADLGDGGL